MTKTRPIRIYKEKKTGKYFFYKTDDRLNRSKVYLKLPKSVDTLREAQKYVIEKAPKMIQKTIINNIIQKSRTNYRKRDKNKLIKPVVSNVREPLLYSTGLVVDGKNTPSYDKYDQLTQLARRTPSADKQIVEVKVAPQSTDLVPPDKKYTTDTKKYTIDELKNLMDYYINQTKDISTADSGSIRNTPKIEEIQDEPVEEVDEPADKPADEPANEPANEPIIETKTETKMEETKTPKKKKMNAAELQEYRTYRGSILGITKKINRDRKKLESGTLPQNVMDSLAREINDSLANLAKYEGYIKDLRGYGSDNSVINGSDNSVINGSDNSVINGSSKDSKRDSYLTGLWDDQIADYFKNEPRFGGVIASDEIDKLPVQLPIGFIMNTAKSTDEKGEHWVACYINNDSLEYYDSEAYPPTKDFIKDIKRYMNVNLCLPNMLKFKVNRIKHQDPKTGFCGYHAIKFLDDRFDGIPYDLTTRFNKKIIDDSKAGKSAIKEEFKLI